MRLEDKTITMPLTSAEHPYSQSQNVTILAKIFWVKKWKKKKINQSEPHLQNPEVLDAREVHFGDSGDVVSVQIPAGRNMGLGIQFESECRSSYKWNRTHQQSEKHQRSYCTGTGRILCMPICRHTTAMNYLNLPSKENKMGEFFPPILSIIRD